MANQLDKNNLPEKESPVVSLQQLSLMDKALSYNFSPETTNPVFTPTTGELLYDPSIVQRQTGTTGLAGRLHR